MTLSLYDISIPASKQLLEAVDHFMTKSALHFNEFGISLDEVINTRLRDDMKPFRSQIAYTVLFIKGSLMALESGEFVRTNDIPDDKSFAELQEFVRTQRTELDQYTPDAVNALTDNEVMIIKLPDIDTPFTATGFMLSFMHPNMYFHASTAYDILRIKGAPLGKRDMLGMMRRKPI